jgi:hypothetical protein
MGTALADKKPLDEMTIFDMVTELRDTKNPTSGKQHHSLTELSKIAGAPVGWAYSALNGPRKNNARSEKYLVPLRNYLKDRRHEQLYHEEKERHIPRSAEPVTAPARKIDPTFARQFSDVKKMETRPPTPNGTGTTEQRGNTLIQTAGNGARVVTKIPPPPAPVKSVEQKLSFMEHFETTKKKLWDAATEFDDLIVDAPPLFKPGVTSLRDKLLGLLGEMET